MQSVVTGPLQQRRQDWRQGIVDQEPHSPAGERQSTFPNGLGGEEQQRFADVLRFEIRVEREDLVPRLSFGDQRHDRGDWIHSPRGQGTHLAGERSPA
jgi:hypothetical protein